MSEPLPVVRHNAAAHRYELAADGDVAVAEYQIDGHTITFTHTWVPPALRGRGLAEQLVRQALDDARADARRVVPQCSYVARFISRHPGYQSLVDA
ncbi:N-acetyltransferase [Horticoccus luteus]|uniref:N-acetyltransferase n=1 Tax=Horticoccus luteus TaxID=2862869 RepID=A0A8F9TVJ6_9BACT|nr:GNAT family N-acetyltransferase [Horticoccus luteus]QYM79906.1 N-acetyltransferase [Horticoccus luteus]